MINHDIPSHWDQKHASTTKRWHGSDNESVYKKNCADPHRLQLLQQYGWTECHDLTYSFNSQGFRDDEFDQQPATLALGCSFTQGVGLKVDQCWPRQLENLLQKKVWNLGIGGMCLDTCYRLLEYWINHLNVDSVFCAVPPLPRYEVFSNNEWLSVYPNGQIADWLEGYHKNYLMFDENSQLNRSKNIRAMRDICFQHNVPFYFDYLDNFYHFKNDTLARDLLHQGPPHQAKLAEDFFTQVKRKKQNEFTTSRCQQT
jgi:hypothetical protein